MGHHYGANRISYGVQQQAYYHHARGSSSLSRDFIPISVNSSGVVGSAGSLYPRGLWKICFFWVIFCYYGDGDFAFFVCSSAFLLRNYWLNSKLN